VNYAQARPLIKNGDMVAVRSNHGGFPALVRAVTGSPYTHTAVALWLEGGLGAGTSCNAAVPGGHDPCGLYIAEMDGAKAVLVPLSQYADSNLDIFDCPVDGEAAKAAALAMLRQRIDYDYADLLRIAAWRLLRLPLPAEDKNGLVCSALTARVFLAAGWKTNRIPSIPSPDDMVRALGGIPKLTIRTA
jgi:hypothetical protein